jgi:hypothetical protein
MPGYNNPELRELKKKVTEINVVITWKGAEQWFHAT